MTTATMGKIKPFEFKDKKTGNTIKVEVSDFYTVLSVNGRFYYFDLKTGEFDGVSANVSQGN